MRGNADGVELDHPSLRRPSREDVGYDVFRAQRLERGAGARVAAANQRECDVELLAAHVHLALEGGELLASHQLEMPVGEGARRGEAGSRGVELRELQLDALGDGAGADAGRIEAAGQWRARAGRPRHRLAPRPRPHRRSRPGFGQVAVVIDRVDDGARRSCERGGRAARARLIAGSNPALGALVAARNVNSPSTRPISIWPSTPGLPGHSGARTVGATAIAVPVCAEHVARDFRCCLHWRGAGTNADPVASPKSNGARSCGSMHPSVWSCCGTGPVKIPPSAMNSNRSRSWPPQGDEQHQPRDLLRVGNARNRRSPTCPGHRRRH